VQKLTRRNTMTILTPKKSISTIAVITFMALSLIAVQPGSSNAEKCDDECPFVGGTKDNCVPNENNEIKEHCKTDADKEREKKEKEKKKK
jgi:hypothetical protein